MVAYQFTIEAGRHASEDRKGRDIHNRSFLSRLHWGTTSCSSVPFSNDKSIYPVQVFDEYPSTFAALGAYLIPINCSKVDWPNRHPARAKRY
jgi:hypothetical protein